MTRISVQGAVMRWVSTRSVSESAKADGAERGDDEL